MQKPSLSESKLLIGQAVKNMREELRLDIEQFAMLCGLNSSTLTNIESGDDFTIAMLQQIAEAHQQYIQ